MNRDLLTGSLGPDRLTARFQDTQSPKSLIDLRSPKPSSLSPDLIASIEHELREAVVIFEREKQRLNGEIQRLTSQLKASESQFACEKSEMLSKFTAERRALDRRIEDLQQKASSAPVDALQARIRQLEASNNDLTSTNAALVEANRTLTAQISKQQTQLAVCAEEQLGLLTSHRKMQQTLQERVQVEAALKSQLAALQSEKDRMCHSLASERDRLSTRVAKLEAEVKGKEPRDFNLVNFEGQMRDNSRRIQSLEELIHETSQRYSELKSSFIEDKRDRLQSHSTRSLTPQRRKASPKPKTTSHHTKKLSWKQPR